MDFPILDLMDQEGCCQKLFDLLHPDGSSCPRCGVREGLSVHRRRPDSPVVDYRCTGCSRVFNMVTGTLWQGTHLSPAQILLILRGIAQGVPTAKLAREVGISRQHLVRLRHQIQARALAAADRSPLPDDRTEADEMYQNAGEKRRLLAEHHRTLTRPGVVFSSRSPPWLALSALSDPSPSPGRWFVPSKCRPASTPRISPTSAVDATCTAPSPATGTSGWSAPRGCWSGPDGSPGHSSTPSTWGTSPHRVAPSP